MLLQKSRRFSIFSRGPISPVAAEPSDPDSGVPDATDIHHQHPPPPAATARAFSKSRNTTHSLSRLISAPSDFQHISHQGPDVQINLIDLDVVRAQMAVARGTPAEPVRSSTGNFGQQQLLQQHQVLSRHRESQASLHSSSSLHSTDQVSRLNRD